MNHRSFLRAAALPLLLFTIWSTSAIATEKLICASPTIYTELIRANGKYNLAFTLKNQTSTNIILEPFYFGENMLQLRATESDGDTALKQAVPLLSPGVGKIVIAPGKTFVRKVDLDGFFPDLQAAITNGDVHVSWELSLKNEESCSSQKINATMTIPKGR